MISMGVIEWIKEENLFKINDPDLWENVPYNSGYNENRSKDLFIVNLKHSGH